MAATTVHARTGAGKAFCSGADTDVLARALKDDLRRTVNDQSAWDRAMESERARQMWSLARTKES